MPIIEANIKENIFVNQPSFIDFRSIERELAESSIKYISNHFRAVSRELR